ncbi:MAG: hypothetical protein ACK5VI_10910 [Opitutia bacterium]|jgi:hypothetical protein
MGRWSPTVVAEAPNRGPGFLATALQSGLNAYDGLQDRRAKDRELAMQQQRIDEERSWREMQQNRWKMDDERQAAEWTAGKLERGWTETDPSQQQGVGARQELDPRPYPAWYKEEEDRIKADADRMYPGSGVMQQRDPVSGRTMYLPVKERYLQSEREKLRARLREEEKARTDQANELHIFEKKDNIRTQNDIKIARARASASGNGGAASDPAKNVAAAYDDEVGIAKTQVDDLRQSAQMYGSMSNNAFQSANMKGGKENAARQEGAIQELRAATIRLQRLREGGVDGFARARADEALGQEIGALSQRVAAVTNDPRLSPQEREQILREFQTVSDEITRRNRAGLNRARSPLAKSLQSP